jgi:DNA mismatch repair protein MutS2
MRDDLDQAFKQAHDEVADVIRELQRGPSSQQAAEARRQLLNLAEAAEETANKVGVSPSESPPAKLAPIDWRTTAPGDRISLELGGEGIVESLPDRKGRVGVRVGGKKLMIPAERVGHRPEKQEQEQARLNKNRVSVERALPSETEGTLGGGMVECDLRGERVEEALQRLREVLDRAAADGRDGVRIIHGIGTGALRSAVREELAVSNYVREVETAAASEGGAGVTLAGLSKPG